MSSQDSYSDIEVEETSALSTPDVTLSSSATTSGTNQQDTAPTEAVTQAKKRKLTSKVWEHFERVVESQYYPDSSCIVFN
jgi:hypothetical protein